MEDAWSWLQLDSRRSAEALPATWRRWFDAGALA